MLKGEARRCYVKAEEKAWVGWQPRDEGARIECKKKVVYTKEGFRKDCLETIQKKTEDAAKEIPHSTKLEKDREERAVARSSRPDERRVLRRQAGKARAAHLIKCSLALSQRIVYIKPQEELHINGEFSENREDWRKELERHCGPEGDDRGAEAEDRMVHQKKVEHFTEHGRAAEISVDLELQAKALLSDNKVRGPEDSVVSEMIKQFHLENLRDYEVHPGTFPGVRAGLGLLEDCQVRFF